MRGATGRELDVTRPKDVSIHAPHAGCDWDMRGVNVITLRFNSRTPCGVRLPRSRLCKALTCFNSRTPCGVRHSTDRDSTLANMFQFTHPMRGATFEEWSFGAYYYCFNSRTPCGVRPHADTDDEERDKFQFTHPMRGATAMPKGTHKWRIR